MCAPILFSKSENLTLTVVFDFFYVISSSCTFCMNKKPQNENMRTLVIVKSVNTFSSIIKMKLRFNLRDTMYFLLSFFFAFTRKKDWGMEKEKMAHVYVFLLK